MRWLLCAVLVLSLTCNVPNPVGTLPTSPATTMELGASVRVAMVANVPIL